MSCRTARRARFRALGISALAFPVIAGAAASAQDQGRVLFNNSCRTCHTIDAGDNRLGPSLHEIVGRKAGSLPDYAYSDALKNSGIGWDEASLDRFIENPDGVVPGNNMKPYAGMTSAEARAAIVAWLKAQSAGGGGG